MPRAPHRERRRTPDSGAKLWTRAQRNRFVPRRAGLPAKTPVLGYLRWTHTAGLQILPSFFTHFHFYSAQASLAKCVFSSTRASKLAGDPGLEEKPRRGSL